MNERAEFIKSQIFDLIKQYHHEVYPPKAFVPGESTVPVSGKVFDEKELQLMTEAALDGVFTTGRFNTEFEKRLAKYIGVNNLITVNSGSSANLIASATLTAEELGERALKAGDEFITVSVSFPTTINPLISFGLVPVFLDINIPTYEIDISRLEEAIGPKTKAIVIAHTLGNTFQVEEISRIAKKHNLWLMEDCCDALGATYNNKHVGTFGDIATISFYPAHHITMGEGGAVFTTNWRLKKIMESFRDWGRDCYCEPGKDNTCKKRFGWQLGSLPFGYDHKYTYSRLGYNLKITDMQAALGLAQLDKLDEFVRIRRRNFDRLKAGLSDLTNKIILPEATPNSNPSWFGFLITLKPDAGISRNDLIDALTERKIATRLLFAGNIIHQPYFKNYQYRVVGELRNAEIVMNQTFWIGVTPMINDEMIDYVIKCIHLTLKK
ncbi:MAG: lipopolysaccharide biosynthesis protein RfbH [Cyclobacteriaceae bacterium]|nr:lipopolysaccharide biosynthesis protein RfbH [Cyclobacteriaceae bacterium]